MQRTYNFKVEDYRIVVDFGRKDKDYSYEVIAKEKDGKVEVLSARSIGKAKDWSKEDINSYLIQMICRD